MYFTGQFFMELPKLLLGRWCLLGVVAGRFSRTVILIRGGTTAALWLQSTLRFLLFLEDRFGLTLGLWGKETHGNVD